MRQSMVFVLLFLAFGLVFSAYLPDYRYSGSWSSRSMSVDSISSRSLSSTSSVTSSPSFCDLIPAFYIQNVKDHLNGSFDPNNALHWRLVFFRNKIIMLEAFDLLESLLKSYLSSPPPTTTFFLFPSSSTIPSWFKLFFRATIEHYFGNQANRSTIDIEEILKYNKSTNCIAYYRDNKSTL